MNFKTLNFISNNWNWMYWRSKQFTSSSERLYLVILKIKNYLFMHCLWLIISAANRSSGLSKIWYFGENCIHIKFCCTQKGKFLESLVSFKVLFPHIMYSLLLLSFDFCCFERLSSSTNTELSASLFFVLFSFRFLFSSPLWDCNVYRYNTH